MSKNWTSPSIGGVSLGGVLLLAAVLVAGCVMFFDAGRVPGDIGDARFNQYVLEHGYLWVKGQVPSFWDAPFFYPARNVLAYSDNHLGSLPLYVPLRWILQDREAAFNAWLVCSCILNFLAAAWVLRRFRLPAVAVVIGAFVFAFSLPVTAKLGHAQVIPRFFVPLAFYAAFRWMESGRPKHWYWLLGLVVAQMYVSIYTGFFLSLCVAAAMLGWLMTGSARRFDLPAWRSRMPSLGTVGISAALMALLLPLAIPYYRASQVLGTRGWEEIFSMLPRIQSYFWAPHSISWSGILPTDSGLPMANEHVMFIGALPLASILLCFFVRGMVTAAPWDRYGRRVNAMLAGLVIVFLLTLVFGGFSFYKFLTALPGVGGIRAITRVILVLLFPIAVMTAFAVARVLDAVERRGWRSGLRHALAALLVVGCLVDQRANTISFDSSYAKDLLRPYAAEIAHTGKPVFWTRPDDPKAPYWKTHLSAMLAAQEAGVKTINGYSGNFPPNYAFDLYTFGQEQCSGFWQWLAVSAFVMEPGEVGVRRPCEGQSLAPLPLLERGFHAWEGIAGRHAWASRKASSMLIPVRPGQEERRLVLEFELTTLVPRSVRFAQVGGEGWQSVSLVPGQPVRVRLPFVLGGRDVRIELQTDQPALRPGNGDPRPISFGISNVRLQPQR